jgi:SOS response regulatory protein OraA/RecX
MSSSLRSVSETSGVSDDVVVTDVSVVDMAVSVGLRLAERAEQSEKRLQEKLVRRGFDADVADSAVEELVRRGAVSDERFSCLWLSGQARRNSASPAYLSASLLAKGIPRQIVRAALQKTLDADTELSLLRRYAAKVTKKRGDQYLTAGLLRHEGFSQIAVEEFLG